MTENICLKDLKDILSKIDDDILKNFVIGSDISRGDIFEGNFELICIKQKKDKDISFFYETEQYKDLILCVIKPLNNSSIKNSRFDPKENVTITTFVDGTIL